jgi:hypothetical protein
MNTMPWWLKHAERNDVVAMELLDQWDHPHIDINFDYDDGEALSIMTTNDGSHTAFMRAIAAGSQEMTMWLLHEADVKDWGTVKCLHYRFPHPREDEDGDDAALVRRRCPYG